MSVTKNLRYPLELQKTLTLKSNSFDALLTKFQFTLEWVDDAVCTCSEFLILTAVK